MPPALTSSLACVGGRRSREGRAAILEKARPSPATANSKLKSSLWLVLHGDEELTCQILPRSEGKTEPSWALQGNTIIDIVERAPSLALCVLPQPDSAQSPDSAAQTP